MASHASVAWLRLKQPEGGYNARQPGFSSSLYNVRLLVLGSLPLLGVFFGFLSVL